jgi:hypothetical protein
VDNGAIVMMEANMIEEHYCLSQILPSLSVDTPQSQCSMHVWCECGALGRSNHYKPHYNDWVWLCTPSRNFAFSVHVKSDLKIKRNGSLHIIPDKRVLLLLAESIHLVSQPLLINEVKAQA